MMNRCEDHRKSIKWVSTTVMVGVGIAMAMAVLELLLTGMMSPAVSPEIKPERLMPEQRKELEQRASEL